MHRFCVLGHKTCGKNFVRVSPVTRPIIPLYLKYV